MKLFHRARSEQEAADFLAQHEGEIVRIGEKGGYVQIVLDPGTPDLHDEADSAEWLAEQEEANER